MRMSPPQKICLWALAMIATALVALAADVAIRPAAPSHPASAGRNPDADGFIQHWLILEPIRSDTPLADNAVKEAVKKQYFPNQLSAIPRNGDKVTVARDSTELVWKILLLHCFLYGIVGQWRVGTNRFENQPVLNETVGVRISPGGSRVRRRGRTNRHIGGQRDECSGDQDRKSTRLNSSHVS